MKVKSLSCVWLFATPWTVAYQAPLSMGFSRQEYWSGLPFPSQRIFLIQGSNPDLLHCRQTLYPVNHQESPDFGEGAEISWSWVSVPFLTFNHQPLNCEGTWGYDLANVLQWAHIEAHSLVEVDLSAILDLVLISLCPALNGYNSFKGCALPPSCLDMY